MRLSGLLVLCAASSLLGATSAPVDRIVVIGDTANASAMKRVDGLDAYLSRRGFPAARLRIDRREIEFEPKTIHTAMRSLLASGPYRAIVAGNMALAQVAHEVDARTPIVFFGATDPVELCLAKTLSHPGFNVTGYTTFAPIAAKMLEALRDAYPRLMRVVVLVDGTKEEEDDDGTQSCDPADGPRPRRIARALGEPCRTGPVAQPESAYIDEVRPMLAYARRQDFELVFHRLCKISDLPGLGVYASNANTTGVLVPAEFLFSQETTRIDAVVAAMNREHFPAIYPRTVFVQRGGLMSLSPIETAPEQPFELVLQVLRGADPGTLPIQIVRAFEVWINLKAAQALGTAPSLRALVRAERLLE